MQATSIAFLLSTVAAVPLPQDGLEPPVVLLLQPSSFEEVFAGFPDFGGFSGFESFPSFSGFDNVPSPPQIELKEIFGADKEQPLHPVVGSECGLICKVFKNLEGLLGVFEDGEGVVRAPVVTEQEDSQAKYDNETNTYHEKVLSDGSILRINKTTIHDTDEQGNGFFFQSSVHHLIKEDEEDTKETEDEIQDSEDEAEVNEEDNGFTNSDDEDVLGFVDEDPTLNEVLDEKFPTASVEDLLE